MRNSQNKVDSVFVLMVFCVFAVSVFLVLMLSGSTYANMVDISSTGQDERIALSYIRTRVRNADEAGSISISDFNGLSALTLSEEFGGINFVTLIYLYNGWVHELFFEEGLDFRPENGTALIRSNSLNFEFVENGLIRVATDYASFLLLPRSTVAIGEVAS